MKNKLFILKRIASTEFGMFGVFIDDTNIPFAVTLERQWNDNKSNISCIPHGKYLCKRVDSPHFGDTFEVANVTGRKHILFHKGNLDDDSHGCILVGEQFEPLYGEPGIRASREGFEEFMSKLQTVDEFDLLILY